MEELETLVQTRVAEVRALVTAAAVRAGRDPSEVAIMAAVKTRSAAEVAATVRAGVSFIGENRVQEGLAHLQVLDSSLRSRARVHFIGLLQANKARKALSTFDSLDSVGSEDLAQRLSRIAQEEALTKDVMIEVNLGEEAQKGGVPSSEVARLAGFVHELPGLRLTGLMGVPPLENEPEASRPFFRELAKLFARVRETHPDPAAFNYLSMGMSHDFEVAVEEGATLVRVGTALYGARRST